MRGGLKGFQGCEWGFKKNSRSSLLAYSKKGTDLGIDTGIATSLTVFSLTQMLHVSRLCTVINLGASERKHSWENVGKYSPTVHHLGNAFSEDGVFFLGGGFKDVLFFTSSGSIFFKCYIEYIYIYFIIRTCIFGNVILNIYI